MSDANRSLSRPSVVILVIALILSSLIFGTGFRTPSAATGFLNPSSPHVAPLLAQSPPADGQSSFQQKCASCHSIGGGKRAGPDLKGVVSLRSADWLVKFIAAPDQVIAQGDPIAKQLVQEYGIPMPNLGVSQQEAREILTYIEAQSGGGQAAPSPTATTPQSAPAAKGNAARGRELFTGQTAFKNGGVACIACHNFNSVGALGGGNVGKDLTPAYSTYGEQGLLPMLKSPPFPVMKEAFADHPITDDEAADLLAFLQETSTRANQAQSQDSLIFVAIGVIGLIIIIGLFQLLWRGRIQGVRQTLVKGGPK